MSPVSPTSEALPTSEVDLLIHSATQLLTLAGGPQRGTDLGRLGIIEDGCMAVVKGQVVAVGKTAKLRTHYHPKKEIDASGKVVMPGFVDPHTHLIWIGDRAQEFERRLKGATYLEIMSSGGGIASTVRKTRAASVQQLVTEARPRLATMLAHGTTTVEAMSGYGLEIETELRLMQAMLELNREGPVEIAPTFLGAHAVPPEYAERSDDYVSMVAGQMLPGLKRWWLENAPQSPLPFVDVFCEVGAFNLAQARIIFETARSLGFPLKVHSDEFNRLGGTALAVELGAVSADHLVHTAQDDFAALGNSQTVAVSLPCTPFGLGEPMYTPAHAILDSGGCLALATDLNPGTAWCESMQFVIALACRAMKLTPAQAIAASTINAAAAIQREDRIGSLEPGKQADLLVLDVPDYRHLGYRFGANLVSFVVKRGRVVVERTA